MHKNSSALEDPTFDKNNFYDLGGALWFSPIAGVIILVTTVQDWTTIDAEP